MNKTNRQKGRPSHRVTITSRCKTSHTAYRSDTWSHALGKGASSMASNLLFILFVWMKAMVVVVKFCVICVIILCRIE